MKDISENAIRRVLNGKATEKEAREVALWLSTPDGQAWLAEEIGNNPGFADIGDENIPSEQMYNEVMRRVEERMRRRRRRRMAWAMAASIFPAVILGAIWIELRVHLGEEIFSPSSIVSETVSHGDRREIIFQDGSKAYLNAGTTISYPEHFGLGARRIVLDGEARFDIASNPRRPFIVEIGKAQIVVKGTLFNVKAYSADRFATVSLIRGAVDFEYGGKSFAMAPSESVVLDKHTNHIEHHKDGWIMDPDAWIDYVLNFRDAPAKELLAELSRLYAVNFIYDDRSADNCSLTFMSNEMSLAKILTEIELISPLSFTNSPDGIHVSTKRKN